MSKLYVAALAALAALSFSASLAFAQTFVRSGGGGMSNRALEGRVTEGDVYTCSAAPGGSRIRPNCDVTEEIERLKQAEMKRLMARPPPLAQCGASTTTESHQLDTIARVSGTLEIRECAAAAGTLTVAVVVKEKSSGEEKPLEFTETWQRSDDRDVSFASDYAIGEDVELVDVHLSGLTCTCADPFAQPAPQPPTEEGQSTPESR